jgi:DNA-binding transcriptional regulator of glucitol operon
MGKPGQGRLFDSMKTKTVKAEVLLEFVAALKAKQEAAATAAATAKRVKELVTSMELPDADVLLKSEDRSIEVLAAWNERNVREVAARTDKFHSFKPVAK